MSSMLPHAASGPARESSGAGERRRQAIARGELTKVTRKDSQFGRGVAVSVPKARLGRRTRAIPSGKPEAWDRTEAVSSLCQCRARLTTGTTSTTRTRDSDVTRMDMTRTCDSDARLGRATRTRDSDTRPESGLQSDQSARRSRGAPFPFPGGICRAGRRRRGGTRLRNRAGAPRHRAGATKSGGSDRRHIRAAALSRRPPPPLPASGSGGPRPLRSRSVSSVAAYLSAPRAGTTRPASPRLPLRSRCRAPCAHRR
jgi:hypothetical protein